MIMKVFRFTSLDNDSWIVEDGGGIKVRWRNLHIKTL